MKLNQGFDVVLEVGDPICVTSHEHTVSLHGYGGCEGNTGYLTWGVKFLVCEKHVQDVEELLRVLKRRLLQQQAIAAAKNGKEIADVG